MEPTNKADAEKQARGWLYSCVRADCPYNWTSFTSSTGPQCCNTLAAAKQFCPVSSGGSPCCPDNYIADGGTCGPKSMPCGKMAQCNNPKYQNAFASTKGIFCCDNTNVARGQYCNGGNSCKPKYTQHYSYTGQPDC